MLPHALLSVMENQGRKAQSKGGREGGGEGAREGESKGGREHTLRNWG